MKNKSANHESRTLTLKEAVMNTERQLIIETLQKTGGNKKKACELLDINRTSFYKRLKTLDIDY